MKAALCSNSLMDSGRGDHTKAQHGSDDCDGQEQGVVMKPDPKSAASRAPQS